MEQSRSKSVGTTVKPLSPLPARNVAYQAAVLGTAMVTVPATVVFRSVTLLDIEVFGVVAVCAGIHLCWSRRIERDRWVLDAHKPHIDLNSIWLVVAALCTHPVLVVALLTGIRMHRWMLCRRPLYRYLFSTASIALSCVAAGWVAQIAGWYPLRIHAGMAVGTVVLLIVVLLVCGATYWGVQAVLVAGAILTARSPRDPRLDLDMIWGNRTDNTVEAGMISGGLLLAAAASLHPTVIVLSVPLMLILHRSILIQRLEEALHLQSEQAAEQWEQAAHTDAKTHVANDAHWRERAVAAIDRAARHGGVVGILVFDLDRFSDVNNQHGHAAGDDVLKTVTATLSRRIRPTDLVGRIGGEEFAVLVPGVAGRHLAGAADRLREDIAGMTVTTVNERGEEITLAVTASVGVASFPAHGPDMATVLRCADAALLAAKRKGRNRIQVATEPIPTPHSARPDTTAATN